MQPRAHVPRFLLVPLLFSLGTCHSQEQKPIAHVCVTAAEYRINTGGKVRARTARTILVGHKHRVDAEQKTF